MEGTITGTPVELPKREVKRVLTITVTDFEDGTRAAFILEEGQEMGCGISAGPREGVEEFIRYRLAALDADSRIAAGWARLESAVRQAIANLDAALREELGG
jgi:hypothetical protein